MQREEFEFNLKKLDGWEREVTASVIEAYWHPLRSIEPKLFAQCILRIIQEDHVFPSVTRILQLSNELAPKKVVKVVQKMAPVEKEAPDLHFTMSFSCLICLVSFASWVDQLDVNKGYGCQGTGMSNCGQVWRADTLIELAKRENLKGALVVTLPKGHTYPSRVMGPSGAL